MEPQHTVDIPHYLRFISPSVLDHQLCKAEVIPTVNPELKIVKGIPPRFAKNVETIESLQFAVTLYERVKGQLNQVLQRREADRKFIDEQTRACNDENLAFGRSYKSSQFKTIIGMKDHEGRVVVGKNNQERDLRMAYGAPVRKIPAHLQGEHVTLFGPPDTAKLCINAMNALHRKLPNEPAIIAELVNKSSLVPKWGADDEDSKTPLRDQLLLAAKNLNESFERTLEYEDVHSGRIYKLEKERLSHPIKRFPGLAIPSVTHFVNGSPLPLHLYDFASHLYLQWNREEALSFYVPKLENEEEAAYIRSMIVTAEHLIKEIHPEYKIGTVSILVVLENPRAIFRLNEIMDSLYPYFVGASLGWHDYLASTARLFKEDSFYRIPIKADANIVIRHIKESHILLAQVVGERGGIKIGGMYGVLPTTRELESPSFQVTIAGYIKDIVIQFKRGLDGFWVAHPDFVRVGIALIEAWREYSANPNSKCLENLVCSLVLDEKIQRSLLEFISSPDIEGLDHTDPLYERALLAADISESKEITNSHPEEVRYNIFQALQYLADWLCGNGCVALPASINGVNVRIMDDLATTERSRWEVWHEIYHGRVSLELFLSLLHEEVSYIKNNLKRENKVVQVRWNEHTAKWYQCAVKLLIILMTSKNPVEFATELLLIFTTGGVRKADDPWEAAMQLEKRFENDISPEDLSTSKFYISPYIRSYLAYFSCCPNSAVASALSHTTFFEEQKARELVSKLNDDEIIRIRDFMYNIQYNQEGLSPNSSVDEVRELAIKKLCSCSSHQSQNFFDKLLELRTTWKVPGVSITISNGINAPLEIISSGYANVEKESYVKNSTLFEVASLSKTVASAFAAEYFGVKGLQTSVNSLLEKYESPFRLRSKEGCPEEWANEVTVKHLLNHTGLGMHYVFGIPLSEPTPDPLDLLNGNEKYGYEAIEVFKEPGTKFNYSGGGFLVLQHLLEIMENKSIEEIFRPFLDALGMDDFTFIQHDTENREYAFGYRESGEAINSFGRLQFPPLAAGGLGSTASLQKFLGHLTAAFHSIDGSSVISHNTACELLYPEDHGSIEFMGAYMGLGIFVAEAGENRFAIHQAANDGFRGMYCHCFVGPDAGKGFSIISNSDNNAVIFNALVAQQILMGLNVNGIDFSQFNVEFNYSGMKQEEIVNYGYKELVFNAFQRDQAPFNKTRGPKDPLASFNLAVGGQVLSVTNDRFAPAINLISPYLPYFDPNGFARQGKIMDSWESARHSHDGRDILRFSLKMPSKIYFISVSTEFHTANNAEYIEIEGLNDSKEWMTILPKSKLYGHSQHRFIVDPSLHSQTFYEIRVHNIPDGGISRLALFDQSLPETEIELFTTTPISKCTSIIPPVKKENVSYAYPTYEMIKRNWNAIVDGTPVNVASATLGAEVIYASNEHYGPAASVIAPFSPRGMFDGFENARSRISGHIDYLVVRLATVAKIESIEFDFKYYPNNNPRFLEVTAYDEADQEFPIVERMFAKPYAGNVLRMPSLNPNVYATRVKIVSIPDGGFNRVRCVTKSWKRPFEE